MYEWNGIKFLLVVYDVSLVKLDVTRVEYKLI